MRRRAPTGATRSRRLLVAAGLLLALVAAVSWRVPAGAGAEGGGALVGEPVLPLAAANVSRFFGASDEEAPGEVWGATALGSIVRYTEAGGWEAVSGVGGQAIRESERAGRTTPKGGVAFLGTAGGAKKLFVRDPGGSFAAAPDPGPLLAAEKPKEELYLTGGEAAAAGGNEAVLVAPLDEPDGRTGAFVVPGVSGLDASARKGVQTAVLRYDGTSWSREEICLDPTPGIACASTFKPKGSFRVLAIGATGTGNAWLLAKSPTATDGVMLLAREPSGNPEGRPVWRPRALGPTGSLGAQLALARPVPGVEVAARTNGQPLTVTANGIWVDAKLTLRSPAVPSGEEAIDATFYLDLSRGQVTASWCDPPANASEAARGLCSFGLGSSLPAGEGRSFAWPGTGAPGDFGARAITGVGQGAMLILEGTGFTRVPIGGGAGAANGAALSAPDAGWLGSGDGPLRLTRSPISAGLQPWPVPFRRPLLAIAPEPGAPVGALSSAALAVGDKGQVARYVPGQGWSPESLLNGAGDRVTPRLRGVAWPEPGLAFAVGDNGAMWLWRASSGLWEPDPGAPPNLIRGNFTGIAFDPANPARGYAVGKQGLLLGYQRGWAQEALPPGVSPEANFSSISFAGNEAMATYKTAIKDPGNGQLRYAGGLLVNNGSGWRVDEGLARVPGLEKTVPQRVAGLPDGGAVVVAEEPNPSASGGVVVSRNGPGLPWQQTGALAAYPAALAAIREGGEVRAIVSVGDPRGQSTWALEAATDREQAFSPPAAGQPPLLTSPYPLPATGFLLRQTATGWRDEQHQAQPLPPSEAGQPGADLPRRPDPLLAMLIAPDGSGGWIVGGETGEEIVNALPALRQQVQTAGVVRYGAGASPPLNASSVPIPPGEGTTFAIGGNAQCAGRCADLAGTGIGPDLWLRAAVARAAGIAGVQDFLYTGAGVAPGEASLLSPSAFRAEEGSYAGRLGAAAGALGVYPAAAASDRDRAGTLSAFASALDPVSPPSAEELSRGYYSFDSGGVRVIVLDYSKPELGAAQRAWLEEQLAAAKTAVPGPEPSIVVGNRDLSGQVPVTPLQPVGSATDASLVVPILVRGGASAYFFDFPEQNRRFRLAAGGRSIPAFGTGTIGYVSPTIEKDFVGASGFLLASVGRPDPVTNVAPVTARLIPSIEDLALDASDGTLLRRSHQALFTALARRPRAGRSCEGSASGVPRSCEIIRPDPYVPIPAECSGPKCATGIFPEYRFVSSEPDVADFVRHDPTSLNPRAIALDGSGRPIADSSSGILCAFNPGTTTVTVEAGGLAYSTKVTVQAGSVQRPCGTVPLRNRPAPEPRLAVPPPPPSPSPAPSFTSPSGSLPPPPPPASSPPPPAPQPVHQPAPAPTPSAFIPAAPVLTPVVAIVPPPPPPAAQTTPPSGTSPVTQPVTAPEPEEEEEAAIQHVHHMAAHRDAGLVPLFWVPTLVLVVALAGTAIADSRRRRPPQLAHSRSTASRRPYR